MERGDTMELIRIEQRTPALLRQLSEVWEQSVRATHFFLSEEDIQRLGRTLPGLLARIPILVAAEEAGVPVGFMGISGRELDMLFLAPQARGRGWGGAMLREAVETYGVDRLCVNEQNPQARAFYEHMGFRVYRRTESDSQGEPFPVLYLKRRIGGPDAVALENRNGVN